MKSLQATTDKILTPVKSAVPAKVCGFFMLIVSITLGGAGVDYLYADTIGYASYYTYASCVREGTSGVYTASGERFNENDYTAAMWGVPFGTIFKVTNINNGTSIKVRINDRGPSKRLVKKGRIIDLSRAAMEAIGGKQALIQGLVKVRIERIR